jgi:prepilin-type N-terminal cleavage/methylation domain-containing protein
MAFTLVEILVVIAVIGILISLLLPAAEATREAARRMQCANHLRQLATALHGYHNSYRMFPYIPYQRGHGNRFGWEVSVLPFLELSTVVDQLDISREFDESPNIDLAKRWVPQVCQCPSAPDYFSIYSGIGSSYAAVMGPGAFRGTDFEDLPEGWCGDLSRDGFLFPGVCRRKADIRDGLSQTLAMGERTYVPGGWIGGIYATNEHTCVWHAKNLRWPINTDPRVVGYYYFDPSLPAGAPVNIEFNDLWFGSEHPGGANFVTVDGGVHFVGEMIDFNVYGDLGTVAGHELVPPTW